MKALNCSILVIGCVLFSAGSRVAAQDWPQWRGPNRDARVADFSAPATWPKELSQKWKAQVGSGDASPALVGERLYVFARQGDNETALCLNAADGKVVWQDRYPAAAVQGAASRHPGPRSSPAVGDGKMVTLGVTGTLSCLDIAGGKVLWRNDEYKGFPRFYTSTSPLIVDGLAIAHLGGQNNGTLAAFDLTSGAAKWKWTGDAPAYSSPIVAELGGVKQVVAMSDKMVVGLALADGKQLWQLPFPLAGRMNYNAATPIVADANTLIVTGAGRGTKALTIEKQGDAFNVKEVWANPDVAPQYNTPVLKNGLLFGISDKANLFCIDAKSGKTAWTDTTRRSNFGSIVDGGSVLFALSEKAELVVFKPEGAAFSEVAKYTVAQSSTYAYPVISGKRIFVKDQDSVILWTVD